MSDKPQIDIAALIDDLINSDWQGRSDSSTLESSSTALFHKGDGIYDIEANTAEGLKRFRNAVVEQGLDHDAQSELDDEYVPWQDLDEDEEYSAPYDAADGITDYVGRLRSASRYDRHRLLIEAESMQFEGAEREDLQGFLRTYIEESRDSTDREELVAVASAIRKCVAMSDAKDIGWLATVLEPGHRVQPSLDTELEIAKMVYRKFSANPPAESDPQPELANRLAELATDYLRPRIFTRDRFSTVAMLATQALLVMRSNRAGAVIDQINDLPFAWFRKQLRRRIGRYAQQLPTDWEGTEHLHQLIAQIVD